MIFKCCISNDFAENQPLFFKSIFQQRKLIFKTGIPCVPAYHTKDKSSHDICVSEFMFPRDELMLVMGSFQMLVTDVYNHRFHKLFSPDDALCNVIDKDDINV